MAILAMLAIVAMIGAMGVALSAISRRRDSNALRARINAYGSKTQ